MKTKAGLTLVVIVAMATVASAAKLVVLATNSGNGTVTGSQPPVSPVGAKGFLIGIDNTTDPLAPLAFQNITFSGPNLVQRLAPNSFAGGDLDSPNVQTRSEAGTANGPDPVAGSTFARNDSWWWNQAQDGLTLGPVATGIQGGLPGGPMTMTGSYNLSGNVPPGQWRLAYVLATGDINVSGLLASGAVGFDALGRPPGTPPLGIILDFDLGTFVQGPPQWLQPAGGVFSNGANWTGGTSPTATESALFDLSATYTVTFNSAQTNDRLDIRQGSVAFDLGGFTYQLTSAGQDSVNVANPAGGIATLSLLNGTVLGVNSTIGSGPGSNGEVTVGAGATWTNSGNVKVGGGTGLVTVNPGGAANVGGVLTVTTGGTITLAGGTLHAPTFNVAGGTFNRNSGSLQLAGGTLSVTAGGQVNGAFDVENGDSVSVDGPGSDWQSLAAVRVGGVGVGDVSVSAGASVTNTATRIGFATGSQGIVAISGAGSTWESSDGMEVGSEIGKGTLTASAGGKVLTTSVSIGELAGAIGTMSVTGSGSSATLSDKLEVGVIGAGTLEVLTGGAVTAAAAVIARDPGSSGMATVSGASVLNVAGDLSVGKGGTASLQIIGGGHVTNTAGRVGFSPGSQGMVTVTGIGSLWKSTNGIELGSEFGTGQLVVTGGGHVESTTGTIGELVGAHGTATVSGAGSTVSLSDKLELGVLGFGELHVSSGGVVSAPSAEFARSGSSTGTAEVTGAGATLSTTGAMYVGGTAFANGGTATLSVVAGGSVAVGTQLKVWQSGSITVNGGTLTYSALEMAGGVLTQATIDSTGRTATGFGALSGNVAGSGTITASGGTLTLGNPGSATGVNLTGTLNVGNNAHAVLLDADRAVLGSATTLAQGAEVTASNGLTLGAGKTLTGTGNATIHGPFSNGGTVNGPVAIGSQLTFAGDVDWTGSFTGNLQFAGQLIPGTSLSPLLISGNASFASTATLRLPVSGAIVVPPGSMIVAGNVALGGTLDVDLISGIHPALGSTFTVMTFGSRTGDFASYADTLLGGHLEFRPQFTPNSLILKARPVQDGDINLDGTVNIFDINAVSSNWNTAGPQGDANGDGSVNIFDINTISSNWDATDDGGALAVPEPATLTLLLAGLIGVTIGNRCRFGRGTE